MNVLYWTIVFMAKSFQKLQARKLRSEGQSIKEIAKTLEVSVGSVSIWVRDIILTPEQTKVLEKRIGDPHYGRRAAYLELSKNKHQEKIAEIYREGAKRVGKLSGRDIYLLGLALYWGEGFKKDNLVGFATSDPDMARFFIVWLEKVFQTPKSDLILRVTANISHIDNIDKIQAYWCAKLEVDNSAFSKPFFQNTVWKKQYDNADDYRGVIRIRVRRSIHILREIKGALEYVRK